MNTRLTIVLVAIAGACGGQAVIDGSGGAGDNGNGGSTASDPNGPNTTTSSMGTTCASISSCCTSLCSSATSLPCWDPGQRCECSSPSVPECQVPLLSLYQCLEASLPNSLTCGNGEVRLRCGFCDFEVASVPQSCGIIDDNPCVP